MKIKITVILLTLVSLLACKKEEIALNGQLIGRWHLVKKSGGFVGAICEYEPGQSSWTFFAQEAFIHNNLFEPETACDLFHEGTFPYTIIKIEDKLFLKFNKSELGRLIISEDGNTMQIDQNDHSEGTGADGFFFEFERMQEETPKSAGANKNGPT